MTLATTIGRLQTKLLSLMLLALITIVFVFQGGIPYVQLFTIAVIVGLLLEAVWGYFIVHEPGYVTFLLGAVEFMGITAVAVLLDVPITLPQAARYYGISWIVIHLFLLYILPVWRLKWNSEGSELIS